MTNTTTSRTAPSSGPSTDVDVLIIGAGISGIGAASHLKALRPGTSFAILEDRDAIGGTWDLFRYPGIRSDSDMPTFGYGFKPWAHRKSIADGHLILDYLRQTVDEYELARHIRFGHRVVSAEFSSAQGRWTVTAQQHGSRKKARFTARFLFLGTGMYDHDAGFTPKFTGIEDFAGTVIHPQHWPADLDHTGKRVVVIGSGATAVTLIPSMARTAGHVTMLQRSPSYVFSLPAHDSLAHALRKLVGHKRAHRMVRRKNILFTRGIYKASRRMPKLMRRLLIANVRRQLPRHFDVDTHFTPRYDPWDQRLCVVPDGDLFKAISAGRASVVTDHIDRFTKTGILLKSGQELTADIVVTATGLTMSPFGGIRLSVDGRETKPSDTMAYKAMMLSGVPNLVFALGYTNLSWTLKVDLVCEHFCRLLDHMDAHGYTTVAPVLDDPTVERVPYMDLRSNYVLRGIREFPRAGTSGPWTVEMAYERDVERLREGPVEDSALRFTVGGPVPSARPEAAR
ncbi:flavin-binding monooxygenase [Streptomyces viridiviolaceus]|uniref:Flavin-containing monooxygenase n=1 Tax=Streptomyces viridiviolaceus TaxID=68282 RepID=A0ABW2DVX3_9ACTN|nr:NAD(P)/FAD-dependent oxidoreductase [Streptomyces viridiviolaceus]GHB32486.1 flavin-binding monooxygenase [Streptomyces viridiviolaceus]